MCVAALLLRLLAYGRLTSLSPRLLDLTIELSKSLPMFRRLLPASVRMETKLASDLHPVFADPEQLSQVTMNLVLNARDAMPGEGVLRLCTTLLVVDDDAPVRDVTARLLRRHGYQVTEATGPREALAELERHPARFSLLATDVVMPEMSGVELAEAARRLDGELPLLHVRLRAGLARSSGHGQRAAEALQT